MSAILKKVRGAIGRGDLLEAYDLAIAAIEEDATNADLRYLAVQTLAKMGSSKRALKLYYEYEISAIDTCDAAALEGRVFKDRARQGRPERRQERFARAANAYEAAFVRYGAYFPAINAATTALLAGDRPRSERLARAVLADPEIVGATDDYYALASGLEACVLLGDVLCARGWLDRMLAVASVGDDSRASTAAQLALLKPALPDLVDLIDQARAALGNPPVIAFSGHIFRENDPHEPALALAVAATFAKLRPAAAFGALACGADIIIAEAAIAAGVTLHVVLPFAVEDFLDQSVLVGGESWVPRFEACMQAAGRNVTIVSGCGYVGDPGQFSFGTEVAHGLALIRAHPNHAEPIQLAVLQPKAQRGVAGTAHDADFWARLGHRSVIIDPGPIDRDVPKKVIDIPENRTRQSILFADFRGFSQLKEAQLPVFVRDILGAAAMVLDRHGAVVRSRNSWGDAIYAVIDDPIAAVEIALEIQDALRVLPPEIADHVSDAGMRIGIHHGPVYRGVDPILGRETYYGTEVTRTARIEPVTPIGEVYATFAFAAILALRAPDRFALDYVGQIKLAKGYGTLAMYRVSPLDSDAEEVAPRA